MQCFYLITNKQKDKEMETTNEICRFLQDRGKKYFLSKDGFYTKEEEIPKEVDCIVVLGGDGTLLQAARDTLKRNIPLLGVNMGTLGYLAEVEKANLQTALERLLMDEYELEDRMLLSGRIETNHQAEESFALNDIVVARSGSVRVITFTIYVNGQVLNSYQADGVIIATPTGSTGYNMSAGGPIVEPKAKLMLITPICPHTLNTRSIVLSAEDFVEIEIDEGKSGVMQEAEVSFDGSRRVSLKNHDRIQIMQSELKVKIIKLNKVSFLETLHKKMKE